MAIIKNRKKISRTNKLPELEKVNKKLKKEIETKRTIEKSLRESEERYKKLIDMSPDAIVLTDLKANILMVSKQAIKMFGGRSAKQLIGRNAFEFIIPEDQKKATKKMKETLRTGDVRDIEYTLLRIGGEKYPAQLRASLIRDGNGKPKAFLEAVRDISEREKTIAALKDSEGRYKDLFENANDIFYTHDLEGNFISINKAAEQISSYTRKQAAKMNISQIVAPEYLNLVVKMIEKKLKKRITTRYRVEIITRKGSRVPLEVSTRLVYNKNVPVGVQGIARDITDQREYEEKLQNAQEELEKRVEQRTIQLRKTNESLKQEVSERQKVSENLEAEKRKMEMIYKTTKEGITLYDKDTRVVYTNPALVHLFGFKKNIIGLKRSEIAADRHKYYKYKIERSDNFLETERSCLNGRSVSGIFIKIYSKPTKYLEADYVPIKSKKGSVLGMVGSFRDVTLQKTQSENINKNLAEVERQKNRLEVVFKNVEEGVVVMDKRRHIIQANDACEIMSGFLEKEMIGKPYFEIFGCHDRQGNYYPDFDATGKVLTTKESIPYDEHLHNCAEGAERWAGVSYTPILDEKGKIEQIVGVIRDITKIKELEKAKSDFVSVASHELRTPLTVINGYLSILQSGDLGNLDRPESRNAHAAALSKVYNETKRLTSLVEELLNVSRIEGGRLKLTFRKVPIVDIVNEVVFEYRTLTSRKGIFLENDKSMTNGQKLYVVGDKYKLKEVMVNLIDNAIKYTQPGGKITVKCITEKGKINVQVIDTGQGIAPSMLPFIFEKFQQVGRSYLKENKGTGLGLFIVKSLVEMHRGNIYVESKLGKGSTFTLELPVIADS